MIVAAVRSLSGYFNDHLQKTLTLLHCVGWIEQFDGLGIKQFILQRQSGKVLLISY